MSLTLARPGLAPLVDELARRFSEGAPPASIALSRLPAATRVAVADLLGLDKVPPASGRLTTRRLSDALGLASIEELRTAVVAMRGPLPDRRADRLRSQSERDALWGWLAAEARTLSLGGCGGERLAGWVETQQSRGARGGIDVHRRRLERALNVLRALPADIVPLASLAADRAGDPHALDRGRSVAAIVLDAAATALDVPRPVTADETRALWEAVGVAPDPFSSTVLALGLPGDDATPLGKWLGSARAAGQPVVLTLADLRRWPPGPLPATACVFVVENPSLVAEAAAGAWTGPVLVCSSGRPTVAVVELLRRLATAGATLFQHADFDPSGLAITAWLAERAGTTPWRMTATDYRCAVRGRDDRATINGRIPATPWDPSLHRAMAEEAIPVYEEDVRTALLAEIAR